MINRWLVLLSTVFVTSACGLPFDLPGIDSGDSGKKPKNNESPTTPPSDEPKTETPENKLPTTEVENKVTLNLQEFAGEAPKQTAAISCSYSSFNTHRSSYESLSDPDRATCSYGYKKTNDEQTDIPEYKIPAALGNKDPGFPASFGIYPEIKVGNQNTTAISAELPVMPLINTKKCHTAEVRFSHRGTWKNYTMTRNAADDEYFDLQSTDEAPTFTSYTTNLLSGYFTTNTKRDPIDVVYLCDWYALGQIDNDSFESLNGQIKVRTGADSSWNIQVFKNDEKVAERLATTTTDALALLKHSDFDRDEIYKVLIRVETTEGKLLAANDKGLLLNDDELAAWASTCASINSSLTVEKQSSKLQLGLGLCDLTNAFRDSGIATATIAANPEKKAFVAPVHCKITKLEDTYNAFRSYGSSRQSCNFAVPAVLPELPDEAKLGVLKTWESPGDFMSMGLEDIKIEKFLDGKVVLNLVDLTKFNNINRHDCKAAVLSFTTPEGAKKSVTFDALETQYYGSRLSFSRSSSMDVSEEEAAASALSALHTHLKNTAGSTADMDVYLMCNWWAAPQDVVTTTF